MPKKPKGKAKKVSLGPSKGQGAITQEEAEIQRDRVLGGVNTPPAPAAILVQTQPPTEAGANLFGSLAEMWRKDYVDIPLRSVR